MDKLLGAVEALKKLKFSTKEIVAVLKEVNPLVTALLGITIVYSGYCLGNFYIVLFGLLISVLGTGLVNARENTKFLLHHLTDEEFSLIKDILKKGSNIGRVKLLGKSIHTALGLAERGLLKGYNIDKNELNKQIEKDYYKASYDIKTVATFEIPLYLYKHILKNNKKIFRQINEQQKEYLI